MTDKRWRIQTVAGGICLPPVSRSPSGTQWECGGCFARTPHTAIALWCEKQELPWTEIVAPGQLTSDEREAAATARERERCAKVAEDYAPGTRATGEAYTAGCYDIAANHIADRIRKERK